MNILCNNYVPYIVKSSNAEFSPVHVMIAYGKLEVQLHTFLNSTLDVGEWLTLLPSRFAFGNELRYPMYRKLGKSESR